MQIWIVNSERREIQPAILIHQINDEQMLVRLDDGLQMTVPNRVVYQCPDEAARSLDAAGDAE